MKIKPLRATGLYHIKVGSPYERRMIGSAVDALPSGFANGFLQAYVDAMPFGRHVFAGREQLGQIATHIVSFEEQLRPSTGYVGSPRAYDMLVTLANALRPHLPQIAEPGQ